MIPRVLPFALFMAFIALSSLLDWVAGSFPSFPQSSAVDLWLYPVKTIAVAGFLIYFWPRYSELKQQRFWAGWGEFSLSLGVGLLIYFIWVRMDWSWATQGEAAGYNPFLSGAGAGIALAGVRIFGASIVVPVMEELFWRSFLIRYAVNSQFQSVPLGKFTPFSFVVTVLLFGAEHHLWLAGMMAGAAYNLVLYRTGRLWPCILAHAVTNLALGIHVLVTGEWQWW